MRILLVEDERIVALALKHELAARGLDVVAIASNGKDALSAIKAQQPDVVLMDIMIEGDMDGIETARRVALEYTVPIIYLTGESDSDTRRRAMHSGSIKGYLLKPVSTSALTEALLGLELDRATA